MGARWPDVDNFSGFFICPMRFVPGLLSIPDHQVYFVACRRSPQTEKPHCLLVRLSALRLRAVHYAF